MRCVCVACVLSPLLVLRSEIWAGECVEAPIDTVSSLGSVFFTMCVCVCVCVCACVRAMVYERSSPSTIKLLPLVSPCGSVMTCNQL